MFNSRKFLILILLKFFVKECYLVEEVCPDDPNAIVSTCGDPCPETCAHIENRNSHALLCSRICITNGCKCKNGYVLNYDMKKCVLPKDCSKTCSGENMIYKECGSNCPPRCIYKRPKCKKTCVKGCFCKDGYFLSGSKCVAEKDCPCARQNEIHVNCKNLCPKTCKSIQSLIKTTCPTSNKCINGCDCLTGYVRNNDNICVRPRNCFDCSGLNEEYSQCKNQCPDTCNSIATGEKKKCLTIPGCLPGCSCKLGHVRNDTSICVKIEDCFAECNDPNAVITDCPCSLTCENFLANEPASCSDVCLPRGCKCKSGYVLDAYGVCVDPETCYDVYDADEY